MARHDGRPTDSRATSRARRRRARQGELFARAWGGPRLGSGPKRRAPREQVKHRARERFRGARPVHVTLHRMAGLPSLRETAAYRALVAALGAGSERFGLRLVHWSALGNHLHLMVEARDQAALSRGMQGLGVRIARALNRLWRRKGKVFSDRYHAHVLNYPKEVRTALAYVLHNARKHKAIAAGLDAFSSAAWFDGWLGGAPNVRTAVERPRWLLEARSWLLARGWRLGGLLAVEDSS
jgi:REP element-mobilizing transposase RayT